MADYRRCAGWTVRRALKERLIRTGLLTRHAPLGLVFPVLFAADVTLTTMDFSHVHLHTHVVLVGALDLEAYHQLTLHGLEIGPRYLYVMLAVLAVNTTFIVIFYPKLKVMTFDNQFAAVLGIRARLLNTVFMFLMSVRVFRTFFLLLETSS